MYFSRRRGRLGTRELRKPKSLRGGPGGGRNEAVTSAVGTVADAGEEATRAPGTEATGPEEGGEARAPSEADSPEALRETRTGCRSTVASTPVW